MAQFFFTAPDGRRIEYDYHDTAQQQKILAGAFEGVGWHVPDLLGQMPAAADFYFDSVSQVRLDRWSSGRVALIGDAGYAAGPGGNGTGTAVVAAYVLAGELAAAGGDHRAAFARYEHLLRRYVARGQKQARGGRDFLAPATAQEDPAARPVLPDAALPAGQGPDQVPVHPDRDRHQAARVPVAVRRGARPGSGVGFCPDSWHAC